eukprot:gene6158-6227_t
MREPRPPTELTVPPLTSENHSPAIELIGINKAFGAVRANKNVDLRVSRGSIHGIVGENGAGKSTLMSILYGFYEADSGEIKVNGTAVRIRSSREAISHGIGMVHQHFMLVENMTVLDNVMLGAEGGAFLSTGAVQTRAHLAKLARDYGLDVNPLARIGDLSVDKGEGQPGPILLEAIDLVVKDDFGVTRVQGVSFKVHAGEIVGIAGVAGNGQSELMEALAGIRPISSGTILINGVELAEDQRNPRALRAHHVVHVPEDRHKMGLVMSFEANESAILGFHDDAEFGAGLLLDPARMIADLATKMETYDIRPPN